MTPTWTHLHVHSHFSFLDGASAPEALAQRAAEYGQDAHYIAISATNPVRHGTNQT